MNREIKFRYLFTDGANWIMQNFTLAEISNGDPFQLISDNPLLKNYKHVGEDEYTGLKDVNNKEIYEGDVIKIEDKAKRVIIWNDYTYYAFILPFPEKDTIPFPIAHYDMHKDINFEVVGNIYENPELLEK